jgi:hypothetical protein
MPSIGEVYNPLIQAAKTGDPKGHELLKAAGKAIFEANPDRCPSVEDGIEAAKRNLDYFCQYFSESEAAVTKSFYGLGAGFRDICTGKHQFV